MQKGAKGKSDFLRFHAQIDFEWICYIVTNPLLHDTILHMYVLEQHCIINKYNLPLTAPHIIMLGPHEAGVWAKHPSLTLPAPSRGEPSRHLGSSYQQGVSILSPLIADLSGLWGSSMIAPKDYFEDDKEASGILKIIKS